MNTKDSNKFFHKDDFRMEYNSWGEGTRKILALHGFGRNLNDFREFTAPLKKEFTIYAVNIFYHGQSKIIERNPEKDPIKTGEFASFFEAFFDHLECEKIYIMGYSLGGRLGMKITELIPERIEAIFLFAPDGLTKNRWYVLFSHTRLGRSIFKYFIRNNIFYNKVLNSFVRLGIISQKLEGFIRSQTASKELQQKVFDIWASLRKIEPNFGKLKKGLENHNIPVKVFIGTHDNIIPLKNTRKLKQKIPATDIILIKSGHKMLTKKVGEEIKERLLE